ncbi:MAG TPA: hypothetical protein VIV15_07845, partial [Anaerolineales bacterium]
SPPGYGSDPVGVHIEYIIGWHQALTRGGHPQAINKNSNVFHGSVLTHKVAFRPGKLRQG